MAVLRRYYRHVIDWANRLHETLQGQDHVLFESWVKRAAPGCDDYAGPPFQCQPASTPCSMEDVKLGCGAGVPRNLPDNDPNVWSHTRLINDTLAIFRLPPPALDTPRLTMTGQIDGIVNNSDGSTSLNGWACTVGLTRAATVELWVDAPPGQPGAQKLGTYKADWPSENVPCGDTNHPATLNHRYSIPLTPPTNSSGLTSYVPMSPWGKKFYINQLSPIGRPDRISAPPGPPPSGPAVPAERRWAPVEFAQRAKCIDGSNYSFYTALTTDKYTGKPSTKWLVYHEGGGWCQSLDECATRAQTRLGSSKQRPAVIDIQQAQRNDFTSRDPARNPALHDFNFVFLPYCDGGSFTGDAIVPYSGCLACEDGRLHFAGKSNREAVVAAIKQLGFGSATELVVSGCSAGAAAAFIHTDWWSEQVPGAKTRGMPSSGWFYEGEYTRDGKDNYKSLMRNLFTFMNSSSGLSSTSGKACLAAGRNSSCLFAQTVMEFVRTPVFSLNSKYDATMGDGEYPLINGSTATFDWSSNTSVNLEGGDITARFRKSFVPPHGAFLDACREYALTFDWWPFAGQNPRICVAFFRCSPSVRSFDVPNAMCLLRWRRNAYMCAGHHCGTWAGMKFGLDGNATAPKLNATYAFAKWYHATPPTPAFYNNEEEFPCGTCCVN